MLIFVVIAFAMKEAAQGAVARDARLADLLEHTPDRDAGVDQRMRGEHH